MAQENVDTITGEIVKANPRALSDAAVAEITSFDDAVRALQDAGMVPTDISEYGDGFELLEDKSMLVKQPFLVLDWRFNEGAFGNFVSMRVVTKSGQKYIVNDGSTGILAQMETVSADRLKDLGGDVVKAHAGLLCPKGLRVSEYEYVDQTGNKRPAKTYYLAF